MGDRYWISGAQIGMLKGFISALSKADVEKILDDIEENQFIGRIEEGDKDKLRVGIIENMEEKDKNRLEELEEK